MVENLALRRASLVRNAHVARTAEPVKVQGGLLERPLAPIGIEEVEGRRGRQAKVELVLLVLPRRIRILHERLELRVGTEVSRAVHFEAEPRRPLACELGIKREVAAPYPEACPVVDGRIVVVDHRIGVTEDEATHLGLFVPGLRRRSRCGCGTDGNWHGGGGPSGVTGRFFTDCLRLEFGDAPCQGFVCLLQRGVFSLEPPKTLGQCAHLATQRVIGRRSWLRIGRARQYRGENE